MKYLLFLAAALPLYAQVRCQADPDPLKLTQQLYNVRGWGSWTVSCVNDGPATVSISPARIVMALPGLGRISTAQVLAATALGRGRRWQASLLAYSGDVALLAAFAFGGGTIKVSTKATQRIVGAATSWKGTQELLQAKVDGKYPPFDGSQLLGGKTGNEPVTLGPRGSASESIQVLVFSHKRRGAATIIGTILLP